MGAHMCIGMSVDLRGQFRRADSFPHVGSEDQAQVIMLGGKCLYPASHLVSLQSCGENKGMGK